MTTPTAVANDFYVDSPEERRPIRTIKLYIFLGWCVETFFLFFGMVWFPQLHPPLIPRLIWTQIVCGIGMGAAVGALAYVAASGYKQGSRPALITTAIVAGLTYAACGAVCFFVDTRPGMDYWGTTENPSLFLIKGTVGGVLIGVVGSWLLNTQKGVSILNKIPFLR